jgi:hypothetical protein
MLQDGTLQRVVNFIFRMPLQKFIKNAQGALVGRLCEQMVRLQPEERVERIRAEFGAGSIFADE